MRNLQPIETWIVVLSVVTMLVVLAEDVHAAEPLQYNRDIRPLLAENCFACHGADSAAREADLRLDQREVAIELKAIVPGTPGESELIARIMTDDPDLLMPPPETKKSLSDEQKQVLRQWIEDGAEYQQHWSFIAPLRRIASCQRCDVGEKSD